ncbi:host specificity factor TipJ family phage tail protein [Stenotrophomonas sp. NPDC078853]|uniref:host specificity factor TipJ family phage tail protein n=1 Tax=Stenotrophomonas sp. NPDC078853 TaxID=3364534 RepID=UPI00384B7B1F
MAEKSDISSTGRLIVTPHPVLVDGQRNQPADLRPDESLCAFLHRHVTDLDDQDWVVLIGGRAVPRDMWPFVYPKHGQVIEARGAVGRSAVALVATLALTYFTFGFGTATAGWWGAGALSGAWGAAAATGVYMAGSVLINRVLQPKQPKQSAPGQSTYSIAAGRNRARHDQPVGLLIGSMRIAPDLISNYYTHYEGDDQFLSFVLTPGLNVDSVEQLHNGDALLSSFDGVRVWHNGFPGMPSVEIPLYTNPDVTDGGTLLDTSNDPKHQPSAWVQRTSSAGTIRLMVGVEFQIWDRSTKGKDKQNSDQIQVQYRAAGTANWQVFGNYNVRGTNNKSQRASYAIDVPEGQYDVRVRVAGNNTDGSGAEASFVWTTLTSVQRDTASYAGIPRIGIRMQANGQLNGAPDEIRCIAHSMPIPVWTGTEWVTQRTSNAGAWILAYARGIYAPDPIAPGGRALVAGMGLPERQIDLEGLKAFMLHCAANNFTYNNWITDVRSHQQVLDVLALAGFGQISWPRGRLSVGWAADEQPLSGVVNMATIKKGQFQVDYTLTNGADGIEYTYLDSATWQSKTLRVPAPGVTTMLNPAQVSGEGVTTEAHAVMLARWHLAQSLYQYKAISYSTDIEHLSYSRMSMLALQHDMTQWGFGGRVKGASIAGGKVTLQLDEPVPAPAQGNAFVGLRVPGERVYRVLRVQPFAGTSDALVLADAWPADAALPGNSEANPAWDTLWIYDFKQTPGLRVRVTSIRPESDLKGAAVEVVAESPQFWQYVKTGEYVRDPNESLLQTRPVASDLKITERQVVQGDTEYTELQASFAITGPVGDTVVLSDLDGNAALEEVARTVTRTATWRIPGAGTYPVTVRPYSPDGNAGVAASVIYTTRGADAPPVLVDLFDVEQLSGGVRRYTWGFFSDTIQSANFAGVEIRYIAGRHAAPAWDAMTPLGDDGYHASAFEAVLPPAGEWTFACRSRNTAGTLSTGMQVLAKTLPANLGEVIGGIEDSLEEQIQKQVEQQQQIDRDRADSIARDAAEAAERAAAFAQAQVNLVNESALRLADVQSVRDRVVAVAEDVAEEEAARIQAMLNAKLEWKADIAVETTARQTDVESLARQVSSVAAGSGTQFDSKQVWYFDTTVEGWTGNGTPTIVDGWLRPANQASNPYITSPAALAVDGAAYRFIKLRLQRVGTPTWRGLVQWITNADTTWNTAKSVTIPAPNFDANGMATFDVDNVPWNGASPVRQIRLSLASNQTATAYLLFDYIAIGRPTPGASVALVQQETLARQTADATEATQRNTLAVQLRGEYAGNDAAAAQGMIGQVNSARIEGDRVIAERTGLIEARLPAGGGALASQASVTEVDQASIARDDANAQSITNVQSSLQNVGGANLLPNSGFEDFTAANVPRYWGRQTNGGTTGGAQALVPSDRVGSKLAFRIEYTDVPNTRYMEVIQYASSGGAKVEGGKTYVMSVDVKTLAGAGIVLQVAFTGGGATVYRSVNAGLAPNGEYNRYVGVFACPAGYTLGVPYLRVSATPTVNGPMWAEFDNVQLQLGTVATAWQPSAFDLDQQFAANAAATTALSSRVTAAEGRIDTQATALSNVQSSITDLSAQTAANTQATSSLNTRVSSAEGTIASQGAAITNVTAAINASAAAGPNILADSGFEGYAAGASVSTAIAQGTMLAIAAAPGARSYAGQRAARLLRTAGASVSNTDAYFGPVIQSNQGRVYYVEAWVKNDPDATAPMGSMFRLGVSGLNSAGARAWYEAFSPRRLDSVAGWTKVSGYATVSNPTLTVQLWATIAGAGAVAGAALLIDNVQFQDVTDAYNAQQSANATAQATTDLTARVVTAEGKIDTQATALTKVQSSIGAAVGQGSNMLLNGSWDYGATGWNYGANTAYNATEGRGGGGCWKAGSYPDAAAARAADANSGASIPVTPGRSYRVSCWYKMDAAFDGTIANTKLRIGGQTGNLLRTLDFAKTTEWKYMETVYAVPETTSITAFKIQVMRNGALGNVWVDDVIMEDVTDALANAQAASSLNTRVTAAEGTITSQGTAITNVTATANSAKSTADTTASGLSATQATVTQQGNTIVAQGNQINSVQAGLGEKASASALISLDAKVSNSGGGGNLLTNATFPLWRRSGWGWGSNGSGFTELGNPTGNADFIPYGMISAIGATKVGALPTSSGDYLVTEYNIPVTSDNTYCVSAYFNTHRCQIRMWAECFNNLNQTVGYITTDWVGPSGQGKALLREYTRPFGIGKPPGGTSYVKILVQVRGTGESNPYFWMFNPMFSEVVAGATQPPTWSAGGKEDHADISLFTDVNGNISGIQNKNDGTTGEINMLANVLNVLSPGAVDGLELRDGYLRVWRGNVQRIVGNGFGPDGLMDYFGPNVGAGNASKGIATMWMDVNGNAYWGGALAAGVRRNANQSTSIQTVGNNVQVGPFDTNGGNKNVVVSFQRNISRTKWAGGNTGFVAGGGSNYAVIQVFRQVEGQGEGLWVQFTVGGDVNIFNQLDGSDSAESYWSGSYTLNDQSDGTARRTYRAIVADYGERTVTHQSGSFDTQNVTQSLSLVSIEQ